jgi:hypothetical protein
MLAVSGAFPPSSAIALNETNKRTNKYLKVTDATLNNVGLLQGPEYITARYDALESVIK